MGQTPRIDGRLWVHKLIEGDLRFTWEGGDIIGVVPQLLFNTEFEFSLTSPYVGLCIIPPVRLRIGPFVLEYMGADIARDVLIFRLVDCETGGER